ncbi:MAG TPA: hypothetical protein PLI18_10465, partial [Pirellulaceae bacterium]|nr:hypothetical protein [Pirellulaceae bacterium]
AVQLGVLHGAARPPTMLPDPRKTAMDPSGGKRMLTPSPIAIFISAALVDRGGRGDDQFAKEWRGLVQAALPTAKRVDAQLPAPTELADR